MNLALDEVLTLQVGKGLRPPTVRLWGWNRRCVVLGRFQSVRNEVDEANAAMRGMRIVRTELHSRLPRIGTVSETVSFTVGAAWPSSTWARRE